MEATMKQMFLVPLKISKASCQVFSHVDATLSVIWSVSPLVSFPFTLCLFIIYWQSALLPLSKYLESHFFTTPAHPYAC